MQVAEQTGFHPSPSGPAGRHTVGVPRSLGSGSSARMSTWPASFSAGSTSRRSTTSGSCRVTTTTIRCGANMENHPVWDIDPKYRPASSVIQYSHLYGWPAPPDEHIQLVTNSYIIPNMVAKVVTNAAKPKEAIAWAETEIKRTVEEGSRPATSRPPRSPGWPWTP